MEETLAQLEAARVDLDPQFKALRSVMSALNKAIRLASADKADALPMYKALTKLETAAEPVDNPTLHQAVSAFSTTTQTALDNLAYEFAKDLRDAFESRGETLTGRPPTLTINSLTLVINMAVRKGQWFYGKEALTKLIPLSLTGILKAYDSQVKRIVSRTLDNKFVPDLQQAWQDCIDKRKQRPSQGRVNLIEAYSQLTLNRQSNRFWNQPSRSTFKEYERVLFARDLVLAREMSAPPFRLGVATKSQADQASRSLWLPEAGMDGNYYGDITFD